MSNDSSGENYAVESALKRPETNIHPQDEAASTVEPLVAMLQNYDPSNVMEQVLTAKKAAEKRAARCSEFRGKWSGSKQKKESAGVEYAGLVREALTALVSEMSTWANAWKISADASVPPPTSAVPTDAFLKWYVQLPATIDSLPSDAKASLAGCCTPLQVRTVLFKAVHLFSILLHVKPPTDNDKNSGDFEEEVPEQPQLGPPTEQEATIERFQQLGDKWFEKLHAKTNDAYLDDYLVAFSLHEGTEWLQVFAKEGLDPRHAVQLVFAVFLYTVDAKHCGCGSAESCQTLKNEEDAAIKKFKVDTETANDDIKERHAENEELLKDIKRLKKSVETAMRDETRATEEHSKERAIQKRETAAAKIAELEETIKTNEGAIKEKTATVCSASMPTKHQLKPPPPKSAASHGWNGAHWAIANTILRVAFQGPGSAEVRKISADTLTAYQPFIDKIEEALEFLPKQRQTTFRGLPVQLAHNYKLNSPVVFPPFTSTSLVGSEALHFGAGVRKPGTFFIIRNHGGAKISQFSWFPEQAEALINIFSSYKVKNKLSRTILQMLGFEIDIVTLVQDGDANCPDEEVVSSLMQSVKHTRFVYESFLETYVETRVASAPPPQLEENTSKLFSRLPDIFTFKRKATACKEHLDKYLPMTITFSISKALDLVNRDDCRSRKANRLSSGFSDPYVLVLDSEGSIVFKTPVIMDTCQPKWNVKDTTFEWTAHTPADMHLRFIVMDSDEKVPEYNNDQNDYDDEDEWEEEEVMPSHGHHGGYRYNTHDTGGAMSNRCKQRFHVEKRDEYWEEEEYYAYNDDSESETSEPDYEVEPLNLEALANKNSSAIGKSDSFLGECVVDCETLVLRSKQAGGAKQRQALRLQPRYNETDTEILTAVEKNEKVGLGTLTVEWTLDENREWEPIEKLDDINYKPLPYRLLLLGAGGSGKTSAAVATLCWFTKTFKKRAYPILLPLPTVIGLGTTPGAIDTHLLEMTGLTKSQFELLMTKRRVVVLLDSLDECANAANILSRGGLLVGNPLLSQLCIVLSSRDEFFKQRSISNPLTVFGTPEKNNSVGADGSGGCADDDDEEADSRGSAALLYVQPFSEDDAREFCRLKDRIEDGNKHSYSTRTFSKVERLPYVGRTSITSSPILLSMVDTILRHPTFSSTILNEKHKMTLTQPILYERYLELKRDTAIVAGQPPATTWKEKYSQDQLFAACEQIALTMFARDKWSMKLAEVVDCLKNGGVPELTHFHLPLRIEDPYDPEANVSWSHKSVAEYLVARAMARRGNPREILETYCGTQRGGSNADGAMIHLNASSGGESIVILFREMFIGGAISSEARQAIVSSLKAWAIEEGKQHDNDSYQAMTASPLQKQQTVARHSNILRLLSLFQISDLTLANLRFENLNLQESQWSNVTIDRCEFINCEFQGTFMRGCTVQRTSFPGCGCGFPLPPVQLGNCKASSSTDDRSVITSMRLMMPSSVCEGGKRGKNYATIVTVDTDHKVKLWNWQSAASAKMSAFAEFDVAASALELGPLSGGGRRRCEQIIVVEDQPLPDGIQSGDTWYVLYKVAARPVPAEREEGTPEPFPDLFSFTDYRSFTIRQNTPPLILQPFSASTSRAQGKPLELPLQHTVFIPPQVCIPTNVDLFGGDKAEGPFHRQEAAFLDTIEPENVYSFLRGGNGYLFVEVKESSYYSNQEGHSCLSCRVPKKTVEFLINIGPNGAPSVPTTTGKKVTSSKKQPKELLALHASIPAKNRKRLRASKSSHWGRQHPTAIDYTITKGGTTTWMQLTHELYNITTSFVLPSKPVLDPLYTPDGSFCITVHQEEKEDCAPSLHFWSLRDDDLSTNARLVENSLSRDEDGNKKKDVIVACALDTKNQQVYVANRGGSVQRFDLVTGTVTDSWDLGLPSSACADDAKEKIVQATIDLMYVDAPMEPTVFVRYEVGSPAANSNTSSASSKAISTTSFTFETHSFHLALRMGHSRVIETSNIQSRLPAACIMDFSGYKEHDLHWIFKRASDTVKHRRHTIAEVTSFVASGYYNKETYKYKYDHYLCFNVGGEQLFKMFLYSDYNRKLDDELFLRGRYRSAIANRQASSVACVDNGPDRDDSPPIHQFDGELLVLGSKDQRTFTAYSFSASHWRPIAQKDRRTSGAVLRNEDEVLKQCPQWSFTTSHDVLSFDFCCHGKYIVLVHAHSCEIRDVAAKGAVSADMRYPPTMTNALPSWHAPPVRVVGDENDVLLGPGFCAQVSSEDGTFVAWSENEADCKLWTPPMDATVSMMMVPQQSATTQQTSSNELAKKNFLCVDDSWTTLAIVKNAAGSASTDGPRVSMYDLTSPPVPEGAPDNKQEESNVGKITEHQPPAAADQQDDDDEEESEDDDDELLEEDTMLRDENEDDEEAQQQPSIEPNLVPIRTLTTCAMFHNEKAVSTSSATSDGADKKTQTTGRMLIRRTPQDRQGFLYKVKGFSKPLVMSSEVVGGEDALKTSASSTIKKKSSAASSKKKKKKTAK